MWRETWAQVNLERLAHNVRALKDCVGSSVQMMATVKANAYGHGVQQVSKAALAAGADQLGVATVEEAVSLRQAGITADILIYGALPASAAEAVVEYDLLSTVMSQADVAVLASAGRKAGKVCRVHLKVDTGMNRLGIKDQDEAVALLQTIANTRGVLLAGVYTHFSSADEPLGVSPSLTDKQRDQFERIVMQARELGVIIPVVHAASSAGVLRDPRCHFDMVRLGIAMYGYHPAPDWRQYIDLQPVLSLHTHVVRIAELTAGEGVSYGQTFVAHRTERVATLPIGYADGIPRSLSNLGSVRINGERAPIIGRVCMDQMMILVTDVSAEVGTEVIIYGETPGTGASLEDAASALATIPYELLCRISERVPRVFGN